MFAPSTLEQQLQAARARFPLGCHVRFRPVMGCPDTEDSRIRSAPWALGHGAIVVAIEGRAGGVSIDHLTRIEGEE